MTNLPTEQNSDKSLCVLIISSLDELDFNCQNQTNARFWRHITTRVILAMLQYQYHQLK